MSGYGLQAHWKPSTRVFRCIWQQLGHFQALETAQSQLRTRAAIAGHKLRRRGWRWRLRLGQCQPRRLHCSFVLLLMLQVASGVGDKETRRHDRQTMLKAALMKHDEAT